MRGLSRTARLVYCQALHVPDLGESKVALFQSVPPHFNCMLQDARYHHRFEFTFRATRNGEGL